MSVIAQLSDRLAALEQLPEQVAALEKRVAELEGKSPDPAPVKKVPKPAEAKEVE